jgi:hypothetical protein
MKIQCDFTTHPLLDDGMKMLVRSSALINPSGTRPALAHIDVPARLARLHRIQLASSSAPPTTPVKHLVNKSRTLLINLNVISCILLPLFRSLLHNG